MTHQEQTNDLQARITRAEHDRDVWQQAGVRERYLEYYFLVMALERQLQQHLGETTH